MYIVCTLYVHCMYIVYTVVGQSPLHCTVLTRFPEDENTWSIDRQFMFGPSLLISPALDEVRSSLIIFIALHLTSDLL